MSEFDGKTVLITGCARARGMGRAIAVAFARAGAGVVATDVASGGTRNENEEGLEEIRLGWKGFENLATARPDDIARLAVFFASEQSDHITGQAWNVDGGMVMH